jgi:FtsP/CotA-like multicopper oxidase with cupredoxin domain
MTIDRRGFLKAAGAGSLLAAAPRLSWPAVAESGDPADYTLRIATGLVELGPQQIVSTTLYNGQFPGPLLRFKEGKPVTIDVFNDSDTPELVHWHGLMIPSEADGTAEEGSPYIPPHGMQRLRFVPRPSGLRFYHSHAAARDDLRRGTYSGQAGPLYVEPASNPGAYDREVFLLLKEFQPSLNRGGDMAMHVLVGSPIAELQELGERADQTFNGPKGYEVGYELFAINGKMLGQGEPIRVKRGERVLFHVVNASAGETRSLALPGHKFTIVALDGNPVPTPAEVPLLWLGTAERISALVTMDHPGVWVMGDLDDDDRGHGMGIVIEYAGERGEPRWLTPEPYLWDYSLFGKAGAQPAAADETIEMTILEHNGELDGFNQWLLNGAAFSMETMQPAYTITQGRRYRLKFRNASDDIHPLHLHRHSFELVRVGGKPSAGVIKDVVMLAGFQELEFDFVADNPGPTLFHCHQQLHMDFGFMSMFNYA